MKRTTRQCIICGAAVWNQNPKVNTCGPICTAAKHSGRTRQEQIEHDIAVEQIETGKEPNWAQAFGGDE